MKLHPAAGTYVDELPTAAAAAAGTSTEHERQLTDHLLCLAGQDGALDEGKKSALVSRTEEPRTLFFFRLLPQQRDFCGRSCACGESSRSRVAAAAAAAAASAAEVRLVWLLSTRHLRGFSSLLMSGNGWKCQIQFHSTPSCVRRYCARDTVFPEP
jgi:hypothetical protein